MHNIPIQWAHSTVNPVMGCDGCELWPAATPLFLDLQKIIHNGANPPSWEAVEKAVEDGFVSVGLTSRLHTNRKAVIAELAGRLNLTPAGCAPARRVREIPAVFKTISMRVRTAPPGSQPSPGRVKRPGKTTQKHEHDNRQKTLRYQPRQQNRLPMERLLPQ